MLKSTYQVLNHAGQVYVNLPGLSRAALEKTGVTKTDNVQETVDRLLESQAQRCENP